MMRPKHLSTFGQIKRPGILADVSLPVPPKPKRKARTSDWDIPPDVSAPDRGIYRRLPLPPVDIDPTPDHEGPDLRPPPHKPGDWEESPGGAGVPGCPECEEESDAEDQHREKRSAAKREAERKWEKEIRDKRAKGLYPVYGPREWGPGRHGDRDVDWETRKERRARQRAVPVEEVRRKQRKRRWEESQSKVGYSRRELYEDRMSERERRGRFRLFGPRKKPCPPGFVRLPFSSNCVRYKGPDTGRITPLLLGAVVAGLVLVIALDR